MFDAPDPPPPYQPSAQEVAAQQAAENEKVASVQDRLRGDTERMFRLYGARTALSGGVSVLGSAISARKSDPYAGSSLVGQAYDDARRANDPYGLASWV